MSRYPGILDKPGKMRTDLPVRDGFSIDTIAQLAKRVGGRCSNPDCRRQTSGPRDDVSKSVNIGVAAHISAASPGGARYDPNISRAARRSISNGVWLCQNCAKLIDNDSERYSVHVLRDWKSIAEESARLELERPAPITEYGPTLYLPGSTNSASWLSYLSGSTTFRGRTDELYLLRSFLEAKEQFRWWIIEIAPELTGHGLPLVKCEAYNRVYDQPYGSS
jgi:hypothetical protein